MVKSIAELFESLDDTSGTALVKAEAVDPSEIIDSPGSELAAMSIAERGEFCFELRVKGYRVKAIASRYKVDPATIYRWIKEYLSEFGQSFESQTKADILMQELVF